jgi:hypothetical protein
MKTSTEFKVGKHGIGYVSSSFISRIKVEEFEPVSAPPRAIVLPRNMTDEKIESELKPGISTLGDVLAVLTSENLEYRDGRLNLFYTPSCVVSVYWDGDGWRVYGWARDGYEWDGGYRVFSPATVSSEPMTSGPMSLESLDARLKKLESIINPSLLK